MILQWGVTLLIRQLVQVLWLRFSYLRGRGKNGLHRCTTPAGETTHCQMIWCGEHTLQRIAVPVGAVSVPGGGAACQKVLYGASAETVGICGHGPNHPEVYYDLFCLGEVQTEVVVLSYRCPPPPQWCVSMPSSVPLFEQFINWGGGGVRVGAIKGQMRDFTSLLKHLLAVCSEPSYV